LGLCLLAGAGLAAGFDAGSQMVFNKIFGVPITSDITWSSAADAASIGAGVDGIVDFVKTINDENSTTWDKTKAGGWAALDALPIAEELASSLKYLDNCSDLLNALRKNLHRLNLDDISLGGIPTKPNPKYARRQTDIIRSSDGAPDILSLNRPISSSPTQNARLYEDIEKLKKQGFREFRVNQEQVNAAGNRVGRNKPDLQATGPDGKRYYWEYDTTQSKRGQPHADRIWSNDPEAGGVFLITQD